MVIRYTRRDQVAAGNDQLGCERTIEKAGCNRQGAVTYVDVDESFCDNIEDVAAEAAIY